MYVQARVANKESATSPRPALEGQAPGSLKEKMALLQQKAQGEQRSPRSQTREGYAPVGTFLLLYHPPTPSTGAKNC